MRLLSRIAWMDRFDLNRRSCLRCESGRGVQHNSFVCRAIWLLSLREIVGLTSNGTKKMDGRLAKMEEGNFIGL